MHVRRYRVGVSVYVCVGYGDAVWLVWGMVVGGGTQSWHLAGVWQGCRAQACRVENIISNFIVSTNSLHCLTHFIISKHYFDSSTPDETSLIMSLLL